MMNLIYKNENRIGFLPLSTKKDGFLSHFDFKILYLQTKKKKTGKGKGKKEEETWTIYPNLRAFNYLHEVFLISFFIN